MCKRSTGGGRPPHPQPSFYKVAMGKHCDVANESQRNHFCFERDEIGYLTHECIVERLKVMIWKENAIYNYDRFVTTNVDPMRRVNPEWRARIAKWSYSVVDHFHLSRECVAVSMNIFDRYFARKTYDANNVDADAVLLVSCATLSIAVKLMEVDVLSLETLSRFSRGKYTTNQILDMEWTVVTALDFYLNPPTAISFASHLLLLLPNEINERDRHELYESTRFAVELSVADSFFVGNKPNPSIIAAAAIIISLEGSALSGSTLSMMKEIHYLDVILKQIGITDAEDLRLKISQQRLNLLLKSNIT